jgi:hypothetical protein
MSQDEKLVQRFYMASRKAPQRRSKQLSIEEIVAAGLDWRTRLLKAIFGRKAPDTPRVNVFVVLTDGRYLFSSELCWGDNPYIFPSWGRNTRQSKILKLKRLGFSGYGLRAEYRNWREQTFLTGPVHVLINPIAGLQWSTATKQLQRPSYSVDGTCLHCPHCSTKFCSNCGQPIPAFRRGVWRGDPIQAEFPPNLGDVYSCD